MSWLDRFGKNLKRECRYITLHGFMNISESKSVLEMTFWLSVQALCFALCLWLMAIHSMRYQSRPTVTTIKSTSFPISDIPFPAVTVCNTHVVYKNHTDFYEKLLLSEGINQTVIDDFFSNLNYMVHISIGLNLNIEKYTEINNIFNKYDISTEQLMKNLSQSCDEMFQQCTWHNNKLNCSEIFRPVKTGMGYCCSFNYFNDFTETEKLKWKKEEPLSSEGSGMAHGLSIQVNFNSGEFMAPLLPFEARYILVHSPFDYADLSVYSIALQPKDFVLVNLSPTVFHADDNIRSLAVKDRLCRFENEGNLETANHYSFINCILECKRKTIFKLCNCVPFLYPFNDDLRQCAFKDIPCLKKNEKLYNNIILEDTSKRNSTICNCLPQCQEIVYEGYVNTLKATLEGQTGIIFIYYDHAWCVEYLKSLNLTWDMLLASLGGIFGLCLGGSLISIIECIFFFIKTIIMTCTKNNDEPKKITKSINSSNIVKVKPKNKY